MAGRGVSGFKMALKLIISCWYIFVLFWVINIFSNKRTLRRGSVRNRWAYTILFWVAVCLLNGWGFQDTNNLMQVILPHSEVLNLIAMVLTVAGLAFAIWARVVLGRNWSATVTFKENHELITQGPYALVRHPIYTAMLTMFLGTALAVGTVGGFVGLGVLYLSFWIKYQQEEAFMIEHFGDQYLDYRKRVCAIVPFAF